MKKRTKIIIGLTITSVIIAGAITTATILLNKKPPYMGAWIETTTSTKYYVEENHIFVKYMIGNSEQYQIKNTKKISNTEYEITLDSGVIFDYKLYNHNNNLHVQHYNTGNWTGDIDFEKIKDDKEK